MLCIEKADHYYIEIVSLRQFLSKHMDYLYIANCIFKIKKNTLVLSIKIIANSLSSLPIGQ